MVDYFSERVSCSAHWRFASGALHFNEAPATTDDRQIICQELKYFLNDCTSFERIIFLRSLHRETY